MLNYSLQHKNVQEKVGGMMGGKVLDLPGIRIYHEGLAQGEKERKELKESNDKLQAEVEQLRKELAQLKAEKNK